MSFTRIGNRLFQTSYILKIEFYHPTRWSHGTIKVNLLCSNSKDLISFPSQDEYFKELQRLQLSLKDPSKVSE